MPPINGRTRTKKQKGAGEHTPVGREAEYVDGVGMVQGVQVLPVI
jgi:hypothetical protein